jgi:hypothetical protein
MLDYGLSSPSISHTVISGDRILGKDIQFSSDKGNVVYIKSVLDPTYISTINKCFSRKLLIDADKLAFRESSCPDSVIKLFKTDPLFSRFQTEIYMFRYFHMDKLFRSEPFYTEMGMSSRPESERNATIKNYIAAYLGTYEAMGCKSLMLTINKFDIHYIWLLGLGRISGLGVETKSQHIEKLKRSLLASNEVNVRYILTTQDTSEVRELRSGCKFFIVDGLSLRMQSDLKIADDYPEVKSNKLGILYLPQEEGEKVQKFKKMSFTGETMAD